ncbi:MAG TPA: murein L,D-transpeptidase catalytic domain family protein [Thermoanaerobaculia bacterium]|nr:murein L,D-transpeptidase catalytic domain family protein [Thermoanaerobaculia bacterium]
MNRPTPSGPFLLALLVPFSLVSIATAPAANARTAADTRPIPPRIAGQLEELHRAAPRLDSKVLALALSAASCATRTGAAPEARYLGVIDYSLPSTHRRFWLFDLEENRLLARELVAHGVNTGGNRSARFSNVEGSRQSSLGLFRTAETYYGRNGYSLRLDGLETGVNELARPRAIVMHGAWYVTNQFAQQHGRLGRSWGCPALDEAVSRKVIDRIQGGHLLFSYYPDEEWLRSSRFLQCPASQPFQQTMVAAAQ